MKRLNFSAWASKVCSCLLIKEKSRPIESLEGYEIQIFDCGVIHHIRFNYYITVDFAERLSLLADALCKYEEKKHDKKNRKISYVGLLERKLMLFADWQDNEILKFKYCLISPEGVLAIFSHDYQFDVYLHKKPHEQTEIYLWQDPERRAEAARRYKKYLIDFDAFHDIDLYYNEMNAYKQSIEEKNLLETQIDSAPHSTKISKI